MMNMKMTPAKKKFVEIAQAEFGEGETLSKEQVVDLKEKYSLGWPSWFVRSPFKVDRGMYRLPTIDGSLDVATVQSPTNTEDANMASLATNVAAARIETAEMVSNVVEFPMNTESYVPAKVNGYVKFGHYADVKTIKKSGQFYPIFITGLSGNGKTMMIEQVHAELKKELFRVNI